MNKLKKPSVAATAPRDADAPRTPPTKNAAESKNHLFRVPLTVGGMVIAIDIPQGDQLDDHPATSAPTRTAAPSVSRSVKSNPAVRMKNVARKAYESLAIWWRGGEILRLAAETTSRRDDPSRRIV